MTFHREPLGLKQPPVVSKSLRDFAKGQTCLLMLPGCPHDDGTTVHAHLRMFGWAGINQKPPDYLGIHACFHCHNILDSRDASAPIGHDDILRGLGNTLIRLSGAGLLHLGRK